MATNIDALALGHFVLLKPAQPPLSEADIRQYIAQFALD
jgi:hypothetical protein